MKHAGAGLFSLAALLAGGGMAPAHSATARPNILFIYTDDQSHRTLSCYRDQGAPSRRRSRYGGAGAWPWVRAPHIDRLVEEGVRFTSDYGASWRTPSRACVLTGPLPWWNSLSQGNYKYIRTLVPDEIEELYDLEADPEELRNLALDPEYDRVLQDCRKRQRVELKRTKAGLVHNLPTPRQPPEARQ